MLEPIICPLTKDVMGFFIGEYQTPLCMPKKLVVIVPGIRSITTYWYDLKLKLAQEPELKDADWFIWNHGAGLLSNTSAFSLAKILNAKINNRFIEGGYEEIILIGHSLGGVVVRSAYLMAVDSQYGEATTSAWGSKVTRIVLLASLNKGIDYDRFKFPNVVLTIVNIINSLRQLFSRNFWRRADNAGRLLITDLWKGSEFISNLRIGWISFFGSNRTQNFPTVVQLLGTEDGLVNKQDSLDVVQFSNADHIIVPHAGHRDIYRLDVLKDAELRSERYEILSRAIIGESKAAATGKSPSEKRKLVVFILPGIRDSNGKWTAKLKQEFENTDGNVKVEIARYGYFSAARFFLPWLRREKVRVFQDQYTEILAQYPDAEFSCVSHSNGTYILGNSLNQLSKMVFSRIYLAGSVLPQEYGWNKHLYSKQVSAVRNDMAALDWPVAILCNGMRGLGMKDVGLGGFDGFNDGITQFSYYKGGHSDAIRSENHPVIVDYILNGKGNVQLDDEVPSFFRKVSNASPWLFRLLILGWIFYCGWLAYHGDSFLTWWLGGGLLAVAIVLFVLEII